MHDGDAWHLVESVTVAQVSMHFEVPASHVQRAPSRWHDVCVGRFQHGPTHAPFCHTQPSAGFCVHAFWSGPVHVLGPHELSTMFHWQFGSLPHCVASVP